MGGRLIGCHYYHPHQENKVKITDAYKQYALYSGINEASVRNSLRSLTMANIIVWGNLSTKACVESERYFERIPKEDQNQVREFLVHILRERGYDV